MEAELADLVAEQLEIEKSHSAVVGMLHRAEKRIEELAAQNDCLHLAYIEASNPGIDIEEVKRSQARAIDTEAKP